MLELVTYLVVWFCLVQLLARYLDINWALFLTSVKVLVPIVAVSTIGSDIISLKDSQNYMQSGADYLFRYQPWEVLYNEHTWELLFKLGDYGYNTFFIWWNALIISLFEAPYSVLLLSNVVLATFAAILVYHISGFGRFSPEYRKGLLVFQLVAIDVLTWSSLTNTRDTLVMFLTVLSIFLFYRVVREKKIVALIMLLAVLTSFLAIRFYIPALLLSSWALYFLLCNHVFVRQHPVALSVVVIVLLSIFFFIVDVGYVTKMLRRIDVLNVLSGVPAFILTPRPWSVAEPYLFLIPSAIYHWLMIIPAALGGLHLWRHHPDVRPLFFYLLIVILFYATLERFIGPRQRYQVSFIFCWFQFHFLYIFVTQRLALLPFRALDRESSGNGEQAV